MGSKTHPSSSSNIVSLLLFPAQPLLIHFHLRQFHHLLCSPQIPSSPLPSSKFFTYFTVFLTMFASSSLTVFRLFPSVSTSRLRVLDLPDCSPSVSLLLSTLLDPVPSQELPVPAASPLLLELDAGAAMLLLVLALKVIVVGRLCPFRSFTRLSCCFHLHSASQLLFNPPSAVFLCALLSPSP